MAALQGSAVKGAFGELLIRHPNFTYPLPWPVRGDIFLGITGQLVALACKF
ncbi:hypothetical protein LMJ38_20680 [Streptomyces sp. R1]|uniref:hypothetical protein n=1 Tax=Streptomyces TaxID=1883 RepID=UPI00130D7517|nr:MULTISPECIES: hypothetical protein [unclassified Streptomyces]MCC8338341.1 hypothetical protein [Streptomyces sp. R1]MYS52465.1 hypothetical protein [Streptomyces sp. SID6013]